MLTKKQKELLLIIKDRLAKDSVPPSFDEMKEALGLKSKSGIHRLISGLEERGFIKRLPHRARALEIVRLPENIENRTIKQNKKEKQFVPITTSSISITPNIVSLPLYGRIAAGTPIEAISHVHEHIEVPVSIISGIKGTRSAEDYYVLEVSGDSMIEAGIMDGDRAIIRRTETADNGTIVVALVDNQEATLKYFEKRGEKIILKPANSHYPAQEYDSSRVKIQGKLAGIMRIY